MRVVRGIVRAVYSYLAQKFSRKSDEKVATLGLVVLAIHISFGGHLDSHIVLCAILNVGVGPSDYYVTICRYQVIGLSF